MHGNHLVCQGVFITEQDSQSVTHTQKQDSLYQQEMDVSLKPQHPEQRTLAAAQGYGMRQQQIHSHKWIAQTVLLVIVLLLFG